MDKLVQMGVWRNKEKDIKKADDKKTDDKKTDDKNRR